VGFSGVLVFWFFGFLGDWGLNPSNAGSLYLLVYIYLHTTYIFLLYAVLKGVLVYYFIRLIHATLRTLTLNLIRPQFGILDFLPSFLLSFLLHLVSHYLFDH
jgi:hypothetical protein